METGPSQQEIDYLLDEAAGIVNDPTTVQQYPEFIERYFTKYYKCLTPKSIQDCLSDIQKQDFDKYDQSNLSCLDQYYFMHSNHIVLFGLAEKHDLLTKIREGVLDKASMKIEFDIKGGSSKTETIKNMTGKKKAGGVQLNARTIICEISCNYTQKPGVKYYKIRSFMDHARMIEINPRVLESPQLLLDQPEKDGFLCIIQLNRAGNLNETEFNCGEDLLRNDFLRIVNIHGPKLVTQDEYRQQSQEKVTCFFVLGGPGSGKGTVCSRLVNEHGFAHLSAGDLLREERDSGSENADLINKICLAGKLVPVEITVNLIKKAMKKQGWNSKKFLIDGFPRNQDNVDGWNRVLASEADVKFVLFLECSQDQMIERIQKRQSEQQRNDDTMEVLLKRFKTFTDQSMPIVGQYEEAGLVKRIDATQEADQVFQSVKDAFGPYL